MNSRWSYCAQKVSADGVPWTRPATHPLEARGLYTVHENIPDEVQREGLLDLRWRDQQNVSSKDQHQEHLVPSRSYPHR